MERLAKKKILPNLDFTDIEVCINCSKGKKLKKKSIQFLEIIHTNICGPFYAPFINRQKYFVTFTNDFSQYGIYLLHDKSHSINALEIYINEVEKQLDKKVKIVKSNTSDEYYGKYDELRQNPRPFAKFLERHGICA